MQKVLLLFPILQNTKLKVGEVKKILPIVLYSQCLNQSLSYSKDQKPLTTLLKPPVKPFMLHVGGP